VYKVNKFPAGGVNTVRMRRNNLGKGRDKSMLASVKKADGEAADRRVR